MPDEHFSFEEHFEKQSDPIIWAKKKALATFSEISEVIGDRNARWVFALWGNGVSKRRQQEIDNHMLLIQLDMMKKPSMLGLAKRLAQENKSLPRAQQKGARGIDVIALEKLIRGAVAKRNKGLEQGTWWGPVTQKQAVRHFGAQKVETSSDEK